MAKIANKYKFQLDLLEEKQAFVVIARTDRLSLLGKLAALNCLAHYNAKCGYSWASVPTIARESGYSASSTKTIKKGLLEIEDVGAFKIIWSKGGDDTHRCCPIMSWFRNEFDRLRTIGKIAKDDHDDFADVREPDNVVDAQHTPRAEDSATPGSGPGHPRFKTRRPRVKNPTKRTDIGTEGRTKREESPDATRLDAGHASQSGDPRRAFEDVAPSAPPASRDDQAALPPISSRRIRGIQARLTAAHPEPHPTQEFVPGPEIDQATYFALRTALTKIGEEDLILAHGRYCEYIRQERSKHGKRSRVRVYATNLASWLSRELWEEELLQEEPAA